MNKKVLVTGGSGFLGSHLVDLLLDQKYKVTNVDKNKYLVKSNNYKYVNSEKLKNTKFKDLIKSNDIIFHFAAQSDIEESSRNPKDTLENNILNTIEILDTLSKCKKNKLFVFASTLYVMGNQGSFYKTSKHCCEKIIFEYAKKFNIKDSILRLGTIYGARASNLNSVQKILSQTLKQSTISINGKGDELREYIHVKDAVRACLNVIKKKLYNKTIMITLNQKTTLKDLTNIINEMFNFKKKFKFLGSNKSHYKFTPYSVDDDTDIIKINLGHFRGLEEGLLDTINLIKKNKFDKN